MNLARSALIIVDMQNDFCPDGALPVPEGDKIVPIINKISSKFYKVIATQDWHPSNHKSFASVHKKNIYDTIELNGITQILWPDHCIQGSKGADFHPELNLNPVDLIIRKGTNPNVDSYSAFQENDKITKTGLEYYLKGLNIKDIYLTGLATDYCVFYTAIDGKEAGFNVYVIIDATQGIDFPEGDLKNKIEIMKKQGIKIIKSEELF